MAAGVLNLTGLSAIEQGASYSHTLTVANGAVPLDLTPYTIRSQIRAEYSDVAPLVAFTCTKITAVSGIFSISLTPAQTSLLAPTGYQYYKYDIELEHTDTSVIRLISGVVEVTAEATRPII